MAVELYKGNYDSDYLKGCTEGLKIRDEDGDGKTTYGEWARYNVRLFHSVFKNNESIEAEAAEIAKEENAIMKKYAGEDGIFDEEEYANCINSPEWDKSIEKFHALKDEIEAYENEETLQEQSETQNAQQEENLGIFDKIKNFFKSLFE